MTDSKQPTEITAEDVLANIVANLPGHIYWKDRQGIYLGCNDYHAQRLGFKSGSEVKGKKDTELLDKESNRRFTHDDEQVMAQGQTRIVEEEITIRGQRVIILSLKSPILAKKRRVLGVLSISLDITRERRLEDRVLMLKEASKGSPPAVTRILIVENDAAAAQNLQQFFAKAGCVIDAVADPASILKQVKKEHYSLIFMDINLADTDGIQVARKIRNQPGKNQTTPIIGFNACE